MIKWNKIALMIDMIMCNVCMIKTSCKECDLLNNDGCDFGLWSYNFKKYINMPLIQKIKKICENHSCIECPISCNKDNECGLYNMSGIIEKHRVEENN